MTNVAKDTHFNPFPSKKIIKRMGFSDDQEGIMRRYINEEGNWNEHLQNSKNFIRETIEKRTPKKVAVLGSGWLLDLPVDFLASYCSKIYLFDIRHPKPIINRLKKYSNVTCIEADITGGLIEYVYQAVKMKDYSFIEHPPHVLFSMKEEVDYTVSLNLINQLDILIIEFLRRKTTFNDAQLIPLRKQIQFNHIKSLTPGASSIICDYQELIFNRTGELIKESPLVFDSFPESSEKKEWTWKFDNNMTYYPNRNTHFKVKAQQL
jgi:hypothetical protein